MQSKAKRSIRTEDGFRTNAEDVLQVEDCSARS